MDVAVQRAVELHHRRPALRIVEEVHFIASPGQTRHQLAVQRVLRRRYHAVSFCHLLLRAQAVVAVGELCYVLRLAGEQFGFCRNVAVQLRARGFYLAIFQCVDVAPAGRDLQITVFNCENVVRVQVGRGVGRIHVAICGDAAVDGDIGRQCADQLYVAVQVGFGQCYSLLPRVRGVPGRVRVRVPAVALLRKGADRVFTCHILAVAGHGGAGLCAGDLTFQQVTVAPFDLHALVLVEAEPAAAALAI